jgi:comEA protein
MTSRSTALATALTVLLVGGTPVLAQKSAAAPAPAPRTEAVNLNTATPAQLASLPGVGSKTAQLIVEYRQKNGGFRKIEELMNVKGIGEKSFLRLRSLVTASGPVKPERAGDSPASASSQAR